MLDTINWYWDYGIKREGEHSISVGKWLDVIEQMRRRSDAIRENLNRERACLAVWGPSQAGKSTMISDAIDANDSGSGKDSALTWCDTELARFTGDAVQNPDTVIFNPYNGNSDGSGVPTRYILKDSVEDIKHPVQIKFASRAQVMLALSIGYLEECGTVRPGRTTHYQYDLDAFVSEIKYFANEARPGKLQRRAVELLQDAADVIDIAILTQERFKNLKGSWAKLRPDMFNNKALLADYDKTLELVTKLLWDDAPPLTDIFKRLMDKMDFVNIQWQGKNVYASMRAANLFLNINTLEDREFKNSLGETHPCEKLGYTIQGDNVYLDTDCGTNPDVAGNSFGLLQALISELQVPLREQTMVANGKTSFVNLLSKADYLDFPGVPNRATGTDAANKVILEDCTDRELLCRVLKQGKTLSMIFMHTRQYAIDSFIILKRFREYPPKTTVLTQGIQSWLQAYDKEWDIFKKSPLKFYINLTFFAEEANKAFTGAVQPATIGNYAKMVEQLPFATPDNARFFLTTYPHFGGDNAFPDDASAKDRVMNMFCNDASFRTLTHLTLDDYRPVFNDADGGVTYLFNQIAGEITSEKRKQYCRELVAADLNSLKKLLEANLPKQGNTNQDQIKRELKAVIDNINKATGPDVLDDDNQSMSFSYKELSEAISSLSAILKNLLTVPTEVLEPIPMEANKLDIDEAKTFIGSQLSHWCEHQLGTTSEMPEVPAYFRNFPLLLSTMKDNCNLEEISKFLVKGELGFISNSTVADTNKKFLAYAISNCLLCGTVERKLDDDNGSPAGGGAGNSVKTALKVFMPSKETKRTRLSFPAYQSLIAPFVKRLEKIVENLKVNETLPQPGDSELQEIYQKLG